MSIKLKEALLINGNVDGILASGNNSAIPFYTSDTVYEDKAYPLIGRRLTSNSGTADYNWDELSVEFSQGGGMDDENDLVGVNAELPHQAKIDGKIYPHIHWVQNSTNTIVFELDYRIQDNGELKDTTWKRMIASSDTDAAFTYVSGDLVQISRFMAGGNPYIDLTGVGISATLQFKLTRTDSTGGVVEGLFYDFHYEIDDLGSKEEYVK